MSWGPLLVNLAVCAGVVAFLMLATFLYAMRTKVHAIMDTVWPLGFVLIAAVSFGLSAGDGASGRRGLVLVLTVIWGCGWARTSSPATSGRARTSGTPRCCAATGAAWPPSCCATSTGRKGGSCGSCRSRCRWPCASGWRYTRHPNYFGDSVVWFGLWLLACSHWLGLLTVVAPIYMTNVLLRHTGKKLLEKHMARSKGAAYTDYERRTSGFIPLPPRAPGAGASWKGLRRSG